MPHAGFIAVHLGAGTHSSKLEATYRTLCSTTCQKGVELLLEGKSALAAACEAMCMLEDAPLTNAGFGSNLNEVGEVECDAGVMVSYKETKKTQFGAVAALKGIKNPILAAKEIIQYQNEPRLLGRTPPLLLVGDGAFQFAKERGVQLVNNPTLISDSALKKYKKYKDRLETAKSAVRDTPPVISIQPMQQSQDTVGVICIDKDGNIASASSSGGISLKLQGRVGQVAIYGCGSWAQHSGRHGVGVTTSGCGEQLIQTTLAKSIGQAVLELGEPALQLKDLMCDRFSQSEALSTDMADKMGGVLVAHYDQEYVDFNMAFTTDSMVVGFMTTAQDKAKVRVSRNSSAFKSSTPSQRLTMEGFIVKL